MISIPEVQSDQHYKIIEERQFFLFFFLLRFPLSLSAKDVILLIVNRFLSLPSSVSQSRPWAQPVRGFASF